MVPPFSHREFPTRQRGASTHLRTGAIDPSPISSRKGPGFVTSHRYTHTASVSPHGSGSARARSAPAAARVMPPSVCAGWRASPMPSHRLTYWCDGRASHVPPACTTGAHHGGRSANMGTTPRVGYTLSISFLVDLGHLMCLCATVRPTAGGGGDDSPPDVVGHVDRHEHAGTQAVVSPHTHTHTQHGPCQSTVYMRCTATERGLGGQIKHPRCSGL